MPGLPYQPVTITRQGAAVGTFLVRFRKRTNRPKQHESPMLEKGQVEKFFVFADLKAPVKTGDFVTFADGQFALIFEVRSYSYSLQADLQMLFGQTYTLWTAPLMSASINAATLNVMDIVYPPKTSTVFAYLEPMGTSDALLTIGTADERMAYAYTTVQLVAKTLLTLAPDCWAVHQTSDYWPLIGVYRTPMRRLIGLPKGVTL